MTSQILLIKIVATVVMLIFFRFLSTDIGRRDHEDDGHGREAQDEIKGAKSKAQKQKEWEQPE